MSWIGSVLLSETHFHAIFSETGEKTRGKEEEEKALEELRWMEVKQWRSMELSSLARGGDLCTKEVGFQTRPERVLSCRHD